MLDSEEGRVDFCCWLPVDVIGRGGLGRGGRHGNDNVDLSPPDA